MSKNKPLNDRMERFLLAAAKGLLGDPRLRAEDAWVQVPGWAAEPARKNYCHFLATGAVEAIPGASIVSGWSLEWMRRTGMEKLEAVMDYHSVVRLADGTLMCPSTNKGEEVSFLPDLKRTYDHESKVVFNLVYFSNQPLRQSFPGVQAIIPAFTPAWRAPLGHGHICSLNQKHARWVSYGFSDPFEFARSEGLDPGNLVDMAFASDLDAVLTSMGIHEIPGSTDEQQAVMQKVHAKFSSGDFGGHDD